MKCTESWVKETLAMWAIDIKSWWKAPHKWVKHLVDEINNNEAWLLCFKGDVSRCVYVSTWDVYYRDTNNQLFLLKEEKQVFPNGKVIRRGLDNSISEKSGRDEDDMIWIIRAVKEELWLTSENIKSILNKWIKEDSRESKAYPWLISKYILAKFQILLDWNIDTNKGFQEAGTEKTIHFVWEAIEDREIDV